MARRGVLILLSCALTLAGAGSAPTWGADGMPAGGPVLWAQMRAPILAQAAPAPSPQAQPQRPRLISLDFKDADINNILRILAEFSGLNIVTSDDVKGKVTVKLQNVPWQQALDSVVRAAKLAYVQEGNIIRVDKLENLTKEAEAQFKADQREVEIQQRRKEADLRLADQERQAALSQLEYDLKRQQLAQQQAPLVEEVIALKYAHVGVKKTQTLDFLSDTFVTQEEKGIEDAITGGAKPGEGKPAGLLSSRGTLTIDQRTNSLVIRDIPDNVSQVKAFVERFDKAAASVLIEARIVEMAKDDARSLGVIWGGIWTPRTGQNGPIATVAGVAPTGTTTPPTGAVGNRTAAASFPAPTPSITQFAATPFGLGLGWLASNLALDLQLQALEGQRRARILSSPNIMTLDNQPANIASGQKFPIISLTVVGGAQQASVSTQDVTTRLQVTPRVIPDTNKLLLGIAVKRDTIVSTVSQAGLLAPVVNTRNAETLAEIPDGGTVVIGGLRESQELSEQQGVPWLNKIPVLGWLFKNDLVEARRTELVIFLTAKVAQTPGQAAVAPAELPVGPGAPPAPGPTGQAPAPAAPAVQPKAVSSVTPAPVPRPAPESRPAAADR